MLGDISNSLSRIAAQTKKTHAGKTDNLKGIIMEELDDYAEDESYPLKPQKILFDTRKVLADEDILISDVGAHKMWIARLYRAECPNTCIISNGFASMGIGVPGAIAAKMAYPQKNVLTITGDAGFMMNSQEIETALRYNVAIVIMIWNDSEYGLIKWHQERRFGHSNDYRCCCRLFREYEVNRKTGPSCLPGIIKKHNINQESLSCLYAINLFCYR